MSRVSDRAVEAALRAYYQDHELSLSDFDGDGIDYRKLMRAALEAAMGADVGIPVSADERARFEAWASAYGHSITHTDTGEFCFIRTRDLWKSWQFDRLAVDAFADAMKDKLDAARAKGRGGWEDPAQCTAADLSRMLRDHVEKGDPRDVANFCMMLHQRGEAIAAREPVGDDLEKVIEDLAEDVETCVSSAVSYLASDAGWDSLGIYRDDAKSRYEALPDRIRALYTTQPHEPKVDLGQFREAVYYSTVNIQGQINGAEHLVKLNELLTLIDSQKDASEPK